MGKTKKQLLVLCFVCVFVLSGVLAGCSSNNNSKKSSANETATTKNTGTTNETENSNANTDKLIEINWLSFNPPETDNTPVQQALEKKFNVKFKNIRVERADYRGQINLKVSSGDIPDVMYLDGGKDVSDLAEQGILAEMPIEEIQAKMPEYAPTVDQVDPNLWKYALVGDKNYAIPLYWEIGNMPFLPAYNGAWLKKIGYDHAPTTLEEFEDVIRKFRNDDPDGNGKKDTFGYSGQGADGRSFTPIFSAFGVKNGWMMDENGSIVHGLMTDGARGAFKLLNKWYKEGLIDPEFITKNADDAHNDFINGIVGVRDWQSYQFNTDTGIIGPRFKAKNPDSELVIGKMLKGTVESVKAYSYGAPNGFIALGAQVAKDEEKKERIFQILRALSSDEETYLLSAYGVEGDHYDMVDGVPIVKPEYSSEVTRNKIGAGTFYSFFYTKTKLMEKYDYTKSALEYIDRVTEGVDVYPTIPGFVSAQNDYPDVGKVANAYFIKFVTGELDGDANFQKFVDEWNKSGQAKITEEFNEKYGDIYK
ncbi:extracellular solute-binding protein [Paenibacillus nasutitermitis]|uniref:Lipoprotein LipO n=1 Tax=Paenibacillus nasutitermitis TaxID=1652958 RepID=A0A916YUC8_9BACL|nr:extracellular solute-binding protein [Paenibacillus nasutitermitis]GGD61669.1 lipoprotein LipO [Paenibacillus nasutitermitis]